MIDYYLALQHCRPKSIWTMGNTYDSLVWDESNLSPKPTESELNEAYIEAKQLLDSQENINIQIKNGFNVLPENFTLGLEEKDRIAFNQMLSLVKEALDLGLITNDSTQIIADKNGVKHTISTLRFRQIMVEYGMYYKSLWDNL